LLPDNGSELYGSFLERQQPDEKISIDAYPSASINAAASLSAWHGHTMVMH